MLSQLDTAVGRVPPHGVPVPTPLNTAASGDAAYTSPHRHAGAIECFSGPSLRPLLFAVKYYGPSFSS